jgi:serine/threonine protein kinase
MDERTNALPVGTELEGYRIVALLGAGGFGITYKAVDVLLDRPLAIKEYLPSILANRGLDKRTVRPFGRQEQEQFAWGLERFRSEAKTLVAFQHPNIVPVHRYFEAYGTGYLVMAFQDGKSLADVIDAVGTLSEDELLTILRPLGAGLADVHAKGFLHRDIKPANIVIRRDGTPVLIDFGSARQSVTRQSRGLTAIVTEGYAPYEQYETDSNQGPWSDIYALGAVLYHCVTGRRPPESPKRIAAHLRKQPDPMVPAKQAAAGSYGESLLEAIDRALAIEEARRPQNVREFMAIVDSKGLADPAMAPPVIPAAGNFMVEPPSVPLMHRTGPPRSGAPRTATAETPADGAAQPPSPSAEPTEADVAGNFMVDAPSVAPARRAGAKPDSRSRSPAPVTDMQTGGATIIIGGADKAAGAEAESGPASVMRSTEAPEPPSSPRARPISREAEPRKRKLLPAIAGGAAIVVLCGVGIAYFAQRSQAPRTATPPTETTTRDTGARDPAAPTAPPKPADEAAAKSKAAPPEAVWERLLVKTGQDVVRRIFVLPNDQFLVVGGRIDAEAIGSDVWLWRYDAKEGKPAGDRKSFTNTRVESGNAVTRLGDGALVIAASRRNPGNNSIVAWVSRIAAEGDVQWQHTFVERSLTVPYAVTAMPNGDIVVVGTATQDDKTGPQGWAARISGDGKTVLWNRVFGKGPDDSFQAVAVLPDGGVIAVGWTSVERNQSEDRNLWIVNLDATGKLRWEKKDLGDETDERGKAVLVAGNGDILIVAEASRAPAQAPPPRPGVPVQPVMDTAPLNKPWLLRLAPDGTVRWEQRYPGAKDKSDSIDAIVPAGDGGFFLAGSTESKGAGRKDGWLLRIDAEGAKLWEKEFGSPFDDEFTALTALPDGGVVTGGGTATKLDLPPTTAPRTPPRTKPEPVPAEAKLWLLRLGYK